MPTNMKKDKEQLEMEVKALLDTYSIPDFDYNQPFDASKKISQKLSYLLSYWGDNEMREFVEHFDSPNKEPVELIQFLRACKGSNIEMKSIVTNPRNKHQVIGTKMHLTLTDKGFLSMFELFVNTWLASLQGGLFECEFGWEEKKPFTIKSETASSPILVGMQHPFYTEPYTDEELKTIADYYDKQDKSRIKHNKSSRLGVIASKILDILKPFDTGCIQTKLFSFVYDLMLLVGQSSGNYIGEGFSGDIGREKTQNIRNWLKAYQLKKEG